MPPRTFSHPPTGNSPQVKLRRTVSRCAEDHGESVRRARSRTPADCSHGALDRHRVGVLGNHAEKVNAPGDCARGRNPSPRGSGRGVQLLNTVAAATLSPSAHAFRRSVISLPRSIARACRASDAHGPRRRRLSGRAGSRGGSSPAGSPGSSEAGGATRRSGLDLSRMIAAGVQRVPQPALLAVIHSRRTRQTPPFRRSQGAHR